MYSQCTRNRKYAQPRRTDPPNTHTHTHHHPPTLEITSPISRPSKFQPLLHATLYPPNYSHYMTTTLPISNSNTYTMTSYFFCADQRILSNRYPVIGKPTYRAGGPGTNSHPSSIPFRSHVSVMTGGSSRHTQREQMHVFQIDSLCCLQSGVSSRGHSAQWKLGVGELRVGCDVDS